MPNSNTDNQLNSPDLWLDDFPFPERNKHKYDRGHLVVVGAPTNLTGAAKLASSAALRASAGLTTIMCPEELLPLYSAPPFAIMYKTYKKESEISDFISGKKINAFLIGPGCSDNDETRSLTLDILDIDKPCLIDAGAIACFADSPDIFIKKLRERTSPTVLTPHEGEFSKVFGKINNRIDDCRDAAQTTNCILLLKGAQTVIADGDGNVVINPTAPPYLATAGSGDVLAGIIAGLLASGMNPFKSTCAGVYIHSQCAARLGIGMIADDIVSAIPEILSKLESCSSIILSSMGKG